MGEKPLVSIVTVVYNGELWIENCIKSVLNQTYNNIEYIIVDGNSTDHTLEVINKYADKIDKIVSEQDTGIYNAMNKGIALSKGAYIGLLNADDCYLPHTVERVVDEFKGGGVDLVYGHMREFVELTDRCLMKTVQSNLDEIKMRMSIFHPTIFVSREVYEKTQGYNEKYKIAADYEFVLHAIKCGFSFAKLNRVLTNFRLLGASSGNCISIVECIQIMEEYETGFAIEYQKRLLKCKVKNGLRFIFNLLIPEDVLIEWREKNIRRKW
ncbi:MAG: glycosyltransferase [Flavobacteriales bacterium]|jgi:glycosyltransferase involved in cell wall biosynthesis|nr:glycosyltransferase [Flavobacteriales bacterium]